MFTAVRFSKRDVYAGGCKSHYAQATVAGILSNQVEEKPAYFAWCWPPGPCYTLRWYRQPPAKSQYVLFQGVTPGSVDGLGGTGVLWNR